MAIIKKYQAKITQITNHGDGVYTLEMESLGRKFKYLPGQFLHIALDEYDPSEGWPESRCFSMQTSPSNNTLKITYAVKGGFTKLMAETLQEGSEVQLKMPYGDLFEQEHEKENTVFIAGGTGLTPFLSLFNDTKFVEYKNPTLYLGLRNQSYNFYNNEIKAASVINTTLKINIVNQEADGILNIEKILNECDKKTSFFISGPPVMIKNFKNYLVKNKIEESNILTDDWE